MRASRMLLALLAACAAVAAPAATTAASSSPAAIPVPSAEAVLGALFKALKITDKDPAQCAGDVRGADHALRDFALDVTASPANYTAGVRSLATGVSRMATAVSSCGVEEVTQKLDALAAALHWAHVSGLDRAAKVLVGAADVEQALAALGSAVAGGDPTAIGDALGALLSKWTAVTGGCAASDHACNIVDGMLKVVQAVAEDIAPCKAALGPAVDALLHGAADMKAKNVSGAVAEFAAGLDGVARAFENDACGLAGLAAVVKPLAPKLAAAVVKADSVAVGYADVYDELYQAALAVERGDIAGFGMQVGRMLQSLRASGCSTKACVVLQGLLGTLQLEAGDFGRCAGDADAAWAHVQSAAASFESKDWVRGAEELAGAVESLARAVSDCGVSQLAQILQDTADKLGDATAAADIGAVASVLIEGADATDDLAQLAADVNSRRWPATGQDLAQLSTFLAGTGCKSLVCKVVEGLLDAAGTAFKDLEGCEADLRAAEDQFVAGAQKFHAKNYLDGVNDWAAGLNMVAKSVSDCGLADELGYIEQEANLLGFSNTSVIGEAVQIAVHGANFYEDLYSTLQDAEGHDWRSAGQDLGKVMNQLSQWTQGHACTSEICYVVLGALQFLGDIEGSVKSCESDFSGAWTDVKNAVAQFHDSHHSIFHFVHDERAVKAGVKDVGQAFTLIAKAVGDCHLEEFAELLSKLAVKLGIVPEVGWLEELLHIVIEGVHIEKEIGAACTDYGNDNWVGFGYNVAALIKTLL